jgi:predicted ATPase
MLNRIKIRDFGPIKEGFKGKDGNDWMDINKVTIFIGNQGSGKSTVAKLISTMSWIEKALVRGEFTEKHLNTHNRFIKHCSYQNIGNYFNEKTIIEYVGKAFSISFKFGKVFIKKNDDNGYSFPKIMYVPSERNFVSSVRNVNTLKGLPNTLYTFSDEYIKAIETIKGQVELPINDAKFEYQKLNKLSWIVGKDYKIKLSEASSGFQSFVPLYIVSNFLSNSLKKKDDNTIKEISIDEEKRIRKEIEQILSNPNISDDVKQASLEFLSAKFTYSSFINIVEEPEQNLFPTSQKQLLNSLLRFNNINDDNKLIITTHSPYLINYLTLAVKANHIFNKLMNFSDKKPSFYLTRINQIVPHKSMVASEDVIIYELSEQDGRIKLLENDNSLPSDENQLNERLGESNELFANLLEIQQQI